MERKLIWKVAAFAQQQGIDNPYRLAEIIGLKYQTCRPIWNGWPKMVSLATMSKLCEGLKCEPSDLFEWEMQKTSGHDRKNGDKKK